MIGASIIKTAAVAAFSAAVGAGVAQKGQPFDKPIRVERVETRELILIDQSGIPIAQWASRGGLVSLEMGGPDRQRGSVLIQADQAGSMIRLLARGMKVSALATTPNQAYPDGNVGLLVERNWKPIWTSPQLQSR